MKLSGRDLPSMYKAGLTIKEENKKQQQGRILETTRTGHVSGPGILNLSLKVTWVQDLFVVIRIETRALGMLSKSFATGLLLQPPFHPDSYPFLEVGSTTLP